MSVTLALLHSGNGAAVVVGACVSMRTGALAAFVVLPATSEIAAFVDTAVPSELSVASAGHVPAMPESVSVHVQWMLTTALYQPFGFAGVVGEPVNVGATWSTLIVTDFDA